MGEVVQRSLFIIHYPPMTSEEVTANAFNLSVSSYVEAPDTRDAIVAEIEN